jgi:TonB family protein
LAATSVWGQQPPQPDKDGVYIAFGDVKPAKLVNAAAAVRPPEANLAGEKHLCTISLVVGADGVPANFIVVSAPKSPFDEAAIAAVKQSQFEPGTLKGRPVPVQAFVWVPFLDPDRPAVPVTGALDAIKGMTSPKPVNNVEAEFSGEARRKHASGTVLIAMMVTEQGLPADVRVATPAGMGLDEEALKAARRYRFKSATLDGVPVSAPIVVEINFRFYNQPQ